ncbi:perlucin-like [Argopecten irradians]|uniref:perlucin-like n=1 Tax=Argopecten irradians TaxID=31199 RepID=UPI0037128716
MPKNGLCFVFLALISATKVSGCHDGWISYRESCYFFSRDTDNWAMANFNCQLFHSELVSITDADENKFLQAELRRLHQFDPHKNTMCYFTSGTDMHVEGQWEWATTQQRFTFTDWYPGEPNNDDYGVIENCLCLYGHYDFHWNDQPCELQNHFICRTEQTHQHNEIIG